MKHLPTIFLLGLLALLPACGGGGAADPVAPAQTFQVGGSVSGLDGTVVLRDASGGQLTLSGNTSFAMSTRLPAGTAYAVSVAQHPVGQDCTVANGSGTVNGDVSNILVQCGAKTYSLTVSLEAVPAALVLTSSLGETLRVSAPGTYTFATPVPHGQAYTVTVQAATTSTSCTVSGGAGLAQGQPLVLQVSCTSASPAPVPPPAPPSPPPPATPADLTVSYAIKSYAFAWSATAGATSYQLFEDPDGPGPLPAAAVGANLATTTFTLNHAVLLPRRFNAQYTVRACSGNGCSGPGAAVQPDLVQAIGYFKASNTQGSDRFGTSVALSADGTTLAVGAQEEDGGVAGVNGNEADNSVANAGAVYVFVRSGTVWSQQAYLKASNPRAQANLGASLGLALSADGNTLAVSASAENSNATGINGNQADTSAASAGAVYVFVRSGAAWSQQAYIKGSNTEAGDSFGSSVALSSDGNTLAVGAAGERSNATGIGGNQADNSLVSAGATYVFTRSGITWSQQAYIKASNTDANDEFGRAVVLSGDGNTLAVGVMFESSNASGINGNQADNSAAGAGAVYVFIRSGVAWSQQAYIKASNPEAGDHFAFSLALSGDGNTLAVAADEEASASAGINGNQADNSAAGAGAVYVFTRSGGAWSQQAYIKASNPQAADDFGFSVALSPDGNTLAVGAIREASNAPGVNGNQADNSVNLAGAAYLFTRSAGSWSQSGYLKAPVPKNTGVMGWSVALSADGSTLAVGSASENSAATGIGGNAADTSAVQAGAVILY